MIRAGLLTASLVAFLAGAAWAQGTPPYTVVGDAIPRSLADKPGEKPDKPGNLAPSLAGAGGRWSVAQLRLRIVDGARLNPDTIMPPYYRTTGLQRVAKPFEGKTILTAEQIEDVVAYLATLKE